MMATTTRPSRRPSLPVGSHLLQAAAGFLCLLLLIAAACNSAHASGPVARTLTGCVVGGLFYSVLTDPAAVKPAKAYRIDTGNSVDLSRYEGKTIALEGLLSPGDHLRLRGGTRPMVKGRSCDPLLRKAIDRELLTDYVVKAHRSASKGDFREAYHFIGMAIEIDSGDCQTYVDRAYIHYLGGDMESGDRDVMLVMNRQCPHMERINFLVLGDTAKLLITRGKRTEAEKIYGFALDTCGSDICRKAVKRDMERLEGSHPR